MYKRQLFNGDAEATGIWVSLFGCLGALGTTFIVIPIVAWLSKKMGKKKAFMVSQSISILGYIMLYFLFIPGKPWMYIIALPFFSFGIGSLFTIMMSMTADVCDLDELENGTRREGVIGAVYWWMVKLGFGVAAMVSGIVLWFVGFDADLVTESSINGMRIFYTLIPIIGIVLAIYIMKDYEIDEDRANKIREQLNSKK